MLKKALICLILACIPAPSLKAAEASNVYPAIVIGGGIGGLTSALYLARAGLHPLVIEGSTPGGALSQSPSVHNWPGEMAISGLDLTEKVRAQVAASGAHFLSEEVVDVDFSTTPYTITTQNLYNKEIKRTLKAKSCIIALGSTPNYLGVSGEKEYWTKGVYSCAVCDGGLYKDKIVAVVGGGDSAVTEAHYLSKIAKKVLVIVRKESLKGFEEQRRKELLATPNVEILYNTTVSEIKGDGSRLTGLQLRQGASESRIAVDALFLAIGATPNGALFQNKLEKDSAGYLVLKKGQQTSKAGVFALGDIVDPDFKQAISAAGDGAKAALQAERYLALQSPSETTSSLPPALASALSGAARVIEVKNLHHFMSEISTTQEAVVVDFYANWCGPCKRLTPEIEKWAKEYAGKVKFLKVNVDQNSELFEKYGIRAMPTALLFKNRGELVETSVGLPNIFKLMDQFKAQNQE